MPSENGGNDGIDGLVQLGWWAEAHPTSCPTARHSCPTAHFYAVIPAPSPPVQTGTETCTTSFPRKWESSSLSFSYLE
ncbi:hypothetical protein [Neisseria lactamica]|uniref:hypothetical protein n=1 Tax=Neisseria lactamica TaxID=486 RepID=UPI00128FD312|nr:hypothetical protein [Neisseria lactamica]